MLKRIRENVSKVIVGKEDVITLLLTALAAGGHVLLEDVPGTGKTVLAKTLARSMDLSFSRIQFTPDLLPSDVTGLHYFDPSRQEFCFRSGPVFTQLLLADEINRATPRTQSALLECMAEQQVSVDGTTMALARPFLVIATQNPVETLGTFPLPEAQLDRFLMKISMGTLAEAGELAMIDRFIRDDPALALKPVASAEDILRLQADCRQVFLHEDLKQYIVRLIHQTRSIGSEGQFQAGVSPRGTLALVRACQARALVEGRDYVVPEDIKDVAVPVLAHRLISDEPGYAGKASFIRGLLGRIPLPTEDWSSR